MKVLMISRSTLYTSWGGDTVQIIETAKSLRLLGVHVDIKLSDEAIDYDSYDLIHFFNIIRPADILRHTDRTKLPFAVSTIFVDYAEYERKCRKGVWGIVNRILPADTIEYLKVIFRYLVNGEKVGSSRYLLLGHRRAVKKVIKEAAVLLPNSLSEYKRLERNYKTGNRFAVIPNAVDLKKFDTQTQHASQREGVLCVARIEGRKNQLLLIEALKGQNIPLYIIGKASDNTLPYYEACKKAAEGSSNIHFIHHVDQTELGAYYHRAKVHVLPSWFETTGLSSLEAAVCGCNIVVTKKGDTEEYFGELAEYCDPESVDSIREAVLKAYNKPQVTELAEIIRRDYNWNKAAEKTMDAYQNLLNRP